jgi:hypothetical protein
MICDFLNNNNLDNHYKYTCFQLHILQYYKLNLSVLETFTPIAKPNN